MPVAQEYQYQNMLPPHYLAIKRYMSNLNDIPVAFGAMGASLVVTLEYGFFEPFLGVGDRWSILRYSRNAAVGTSMATMMRMASKVWSSSERRGGGGDGGGGMTASGFCVTVTESRSTSAGAP